LRQPWAKSKFRDAGLSGAFSLNLINKLKR
jgi:hypothetical protein